MTSIIALLNEKNHYLEKFYALNEKELVNFLRGDFDQLESFYSTRERILEIVKYLDAQIERTQRSEEGRSTPTTCDERRLVREALQIRDQYAARIIEQDLQVLSCIEATKNSIIRELQDLKKNKKAVNSYRAPTFGKRLDEEV